MLRRSDKREAGDSEDERERDAQRYVDTYIESYSKWAMYIYALYRSSTARDMPLKSHCTRGIFLYQTAEKNCIIEHKEKTNM